MKDPVEESSSSPPSEKKQKVKDGSSPHDLKENKATSAQQPNVHIQHHPVVQNFMMNLNAGFSALLHSFQYLKVHELLRASCVSHMWHHIAQHRTLVSFFFPSQWKQIFSIIKRVKRDLGVKRM
jgi:hypothetical protein